MIEFYSPFGMRHFFYIVLTSTKMKIPTKLFTYWAPPFCSIKSAYELPATGVNIGKETYTFTSVQMLYQVE